MAFDINKELQNLESNKEPRTPIEVIKQKFDEKYNPQPLGNDGGETDLLYQGDTNQAARDRVVQENTPWSSSFQNGAEYDQSGNPYHYKSMLGESITDTFNRSAGKGVGQLIGSYGNIINYLAPSWLGFDAYDGNALGNWLKEAGDRRVAQNSVDDMPEELKDPTLNLKTFLNPDFWATYGGEFVPQILEIAGTAALSGGLSTIVKKGASKLAGEQIAKELVETGIEKTILKEGAELTAEQLAKEGGKKAIGSLGKNALKKESIWESWTKLGKVRATTKGEFAGANAVNELDKGSGILGKMITDQGTLVPHFDNILRNVSGGLLMNQRVALDNAGAVYSTYKDMPQVDDDGNIMYDENGKPIPMFTKEELGEMASKTYLMNTAYAAIDIASWGMTFGKGWMKTGSGAKSFINKAASEELKGGIGNIFTKSITPSLKKFGESKLGSTLINTSKFLTKAGAEGLEESVQETWEEWSNMKAYHDVHGSMKGYQGKVTKDYDFNNPLGGYFDYYFSTDSEGLRTIAGAMGGLAGGVFNLRTLVNNNAEKAHKLYNRAENLKTIFSGNSDLDLKGKGMQDYNIRAQMAEAVHQNKGESFVPFIADLYNKGVINEEEFNQYKNMFDVYSQESEGIKKLNISGNQAYMLNFSEELKQRDFINKKVDEYNERILSLNEIYSTDDAALQKKKAEIDSEFKEQMQLSTRLLAQANQNRMKLLKEDVANPVSSVVEKDSNGLYKVKEIKISNDTSNEIENESTAIEEETSIPSLKGIIKTGKEQTKKLTSKTKEVASNLYNSLLSMLEPEKNDNQELNPTENPTATSQNDNIAEVTKGSIQSLKDSLSVGAGININGNDTSITSLSDNGDFEYEIEEKKPSVDFKSFSDAFGQLQDGEEIFGTITSKDTSGGNESQGSDSTETESYVKQGEYFVPKEDLNKSEKWNSDPVKIKRQYKAEDLDKKNQVDRVYKKEFSEKVTKKGKIVNDKIIDSETNEELDYKLPETKKEQNSANQKETKKIVSEVSKLAKDEVEKKYLEEAVLREEKKSLKDSEKDYSEELKKTSNIANQNKSNSEENIDEVKPLKNGRASVAVTESEKASENIKEKSKTEKFLEAIKGNYKNFKGNANDKINELSGPRADIKLMNFSQSLIVEQQLQKVFPGQKPNLFVVDNLSKSIGYPVQGFALLGNIYIDQNSWKQEKAFFHESIHLLYPHIKDSSDVKFIINFAAKNKNLVDKIYNDYDRHILYRVDKTYNQKTKKEESLKEPLFLTKEELVQTITNKSYNSLTQDEINDRLDYFEDKKFIEELPMSEQEILKEELFVSFLQGPLSERYSIFFNEKTGIEENKRQFLTKKFWGDLKKKTSVLEREQSNILKGLAPNEYEDYHNTKDAIFDLFKKGIEGKNITSSGRAMMESSFDKKYINRVNDIYDKRIKNTKEYLGKKIKKEVENKYLEEFSAGFDETERAKLFEQEHGRIIDSATTIIKDFSNTYQKLLKTRNSLLENGNISKKRKIHEFDSDRFEAAIYRISKQSHDADDFIDRIQQSDVDSIFEFNQYLDATRQDKEMMLASMWWTYSNTSIQPTITTTIGVDGSVDVQSSMNYKDSARLKYILDNLSQMDISRFSYGKNKLYQNKLEDANELNESIEKIKSSNYTDFDVYQILKNFSTSSIDIQSIINGGVLNYGGKTVTLREAIEDLVTNPEGFGNYQNSLRKRNETGFALSKKHGSVINKFARAVINTNKFYSNDFTVLDAAKNQVPTRYIKNNLIHTIENMNKNAIRMTEKEFLGRYSNLEGKGSLSNDLLKFWHKEVNNGRPISISRFNGIDNQMLNKSSVIKKSNKTEQSINELIVYKNSLKKSNFLMETGRMGDSPASYYIKVPRIELSKIGNFFIKDGKVDFVFNKNSKAFVDNIYNSLLKMGENIESKEEFKKSIQNGINREIDFINSQSNSLENLKGFKELFNNGKLNDSGKALITEYYVNKLFNSVNFNNIFRPNYNVNDLTKRSKLIHAPKMTFPNTRIEYVFFDDLNVDGANATDSGMYMTQSMAAKIEKAGGNIHNLGKAYKPIHSGVEYQNSNFSGKAIDMKGRITILNDLEIEKNPQLKGLYETLKEREQKYIERTGDFNDDLLNGKNGFLVIAAPLSSAKSDFFPIEIKNKNGELTEKGNYFTLDSLTDATTRNEAHNILDSWYYDNEDFLGLDGQNFGIQQTMDKEFYKSPTPVQLESSITNNALVNGQLKEAEEIQKILSDLKIKDTEEIRKVISSGSQEDLRAFLIKSMDMLVIDPRQKTLIQEGLSMATPDLRELARNTLTNILKVHGNRYVSPGTIAYSKPATYQNPNGYAVNGSTGLSFYSKNANNEITRVGEVVLPKHMDKSDSKLGDKAKLRARKYFTLDSYENLDQAQFAAKMNAIGSTTEPLHEVFKDGELYGYAVPGDHVMVTRVPSHGQMCTAFLEVVDFVDTGASDIQVPTEYSDIIGADHDGDFFFVQHKAKNTINWNLAFDKMENLWLSPKMTKELYQKIDFKEEAKEAQKSVNKVYGNPTDDKILFWSPEGQRQMWANTREAKGIIGNSLNLHRLLGIISNYKVEFSSPIIIDGVESKGFSDFGNGRSRTIASGKVANIVLDNAKDGFTTSLGINDATIPHAMILSNLGYSLEEIGLILRNPVAVQWSKLKEERNNVFQTSSEISSLSQMVRNKIGLQKLPNKNYSINLKEPNSVESKNAILNLMANLENINSDLMKISKILSGHNSMETNPMVMKQQIDEFEDALNNINNKSLIFNEAFKNNPMIQNYLNVAKVNLELQEKMDPVAKEKTSQVYDTFSNAITGNLSSEQHANLRKKLEVFKTARLLGFNNIPKDYYKKLTQQNIYDENGNLVSNPNSVVNRLLNYQNQQKNVMLYIDKKDFRNSVSAFDNSILFNKVLRINGDLIAMNSQFFEALPENSIERENAIKEFSSLPKDLQADLILYDLITHGWTGRSSMFNIFPSSFKEKVSNASQEEFATTSDDVTDSARNKLWNATVINSADVISEIKVNPIDKNQKLNVNELKKTSIGKSILNKIEKGQRVLFKKRIAVENNGKIKYVQKSYYFPGFNSSEVAELNTLKGLELLNTIHEIAGKKIIEKTIENKNNFLDFVAIPDNNVVIDNNDPSKPNLSLEDFTVNNISKSLNRNFNSGRAMMMDNIFEKKNNEFYLDYANTFFNESEYAAINNFKDNSEEFIKKSYSDYVKEFEEAKKIAESLTEEKVEKMSNDELYDSFNKYGLKNKWAYAQVIEPIATEIAIRATQEQMELTKFEGDIKPNGIDDISKIKSYFMSNNIPQNHPHVQSLVRKMELEYKNYLRERAKLIGEVNKVTDDLYAEQFNFKPHGGLIDKIKLLYHTFFSNRENFYQKLYGPLIEFEEVQKPDGSTIRNMKFKTPEQIEFEKKSGKISQAQYNFYKTSKNILDNQMKFTLSEGQLGRKDYIPHTSPSTMEAFSRRGLLGLMANSKNIDERVSDVKMNFFNPITNKSEFVPFSHIQNVYNVLSKTNDKNKLAIDFYKTKKKAFDLLKKGINEDGSKFRISNIEASTAIGDVFMERFSKSRSQKATDFPSLDLNKAMTDYIHSSLFTNGNENFQGFKKMLPLVDGVLAFSNTLENKNMSDYINKVWRQYFLAGSKQPTFKTNSSIAALGVTTDNVIDYLTKASLFYWLGWKGLAVGSGAYAIGNVLVGKYNNIVASGGSKWINGEKRFWFGTSGKIDISDPLKGLRESQEILKRTGFMDVNVYDEVGVEKTGNGLLASFALMPMTYSEKWIQGVQFLGNLSQEQWETLKNGGVIDDEIQAKIEESIKQYHGKGYTPTDQRMIQMYSWGRSIMQFNRWIPSLLNNLFAGKDVNIYGEKTVGAYTQVANTIREMFSGKMNLKEFVSYYKDLDTVEKSRLHQGLSYFGLASLIGGMGVFGDNQIAQRMFSDTHIFLDIDRMEGKLMPKSIAMLDDIL